jgi:hypothetical protein
MANLQDPEKLRLATFGGGEIAGLEKGLVFSGVGP